MATHPIVTWPNQPAPNTQNERIDRLIAVAQKLRQDLEDSTAVRRILQPAYAEWLRTIIEKPVASILNSRLREIAEVSRKLINRIARLITHQSFPSGLAEIRPLPPELAFWQSLHEPPQTDDPPGPDRDPFGRTKITVLILMRTFLFRHLWFPSFRNMYLITPDSQTISEHFETTWEHATFNVKDLLHYGETKAAEKMLETMVGYLEPSLDIPHHNGDNSNEQLNTRVEEMWKEYELLRMCMAWKQDRPDTAEYYLRKFNDRPGNYASLSQAEEAADLLFEIGRDFLRKRQFDPAVRWLGKSFDILSEYESAHLGPDTEDLCVSIGQALVKAMLGSGLDDMKQRAVETIDYLSVKFGDKLIISLLRLETIAVTDPFDVETYTNVILKMIRTIVLTDQNFKCVMRHVRKLKQHSPTHACKALDYLLTIRLLAVENDSWVERACITRLWITTSLPDSDAMIEELHEHMDTILRGRNKPLASAPTHAAQSLMWNRIEDNFNKRQYANAGKWCDLACHRLFEDCGELNQAKISRKRIMCALAARDFGAARSFYHQMSESGKGDRLTKYLVFKIAIRSNDTELAADCLEATGDREQAVLALQKVLQKYNYGAPPGVNIAALLRVTAKMLIGSIETGPDSFDETVIEELCNIFDSVNHAKKPQRTDKDDRSFSTIEQKWVAKTSYEIAIKYCKKMNPKYLLRLVTASVQCIDVLTRDGNGDGSLLPYRIHCAVLAAASAITLARSEDNIESSAQHYLNVRSQTRIFREKLPEALDTSPDEALRNDLLTKHFEILIFEVEALLKLKSWEDMNEVFDAFWKYENANVWSRLADLLLVVYDEGIKSDAPSSTQAKVLAVLQNIINSYWRSSTKDIDQLAQWIRCLFQMALTFDDQISQHCLDQATSIAQRRKGTSHPYPIDELHWLSATAFNRAIDFHCAGDEAACRSWGEKALTLAAEADDNSMLHKAMLARFSGLAWGEK